jgi:predicted nucleic acid-binding protein
MTACLDTNILIYITDQNSPHHSWSVTQLQRSKTQGPVIISDIVYSQFAGGMASRSDADAVISALELERIRSSDEALFRAGKAFVEYKKRRGPKERVIADFIIGATAEAEGLPLVTNNPSDFRSYFPTVTLIHP